MDSGMNCTLYANIYKDFKQNNVLKNKITNLLQAAEEISVVVFSELGAEEIQRKGIQARVDEAEAEACDLEDVPEFVVVTVVKVEPESVNSSWQPAYEEHQNETEHSQSNLKNSNYIDTIR